MAKAKESTKSGSGPGNGRGQTVQGTGKKARKDRQQSRKGGHRGRQKAGSS